MRNLKTVLLMAMLVFIMKQHSLLKKIDAQRDIANKAFAACLKNR